jgi:hypothetical protein
MLNRDDRTVGDGHQKIVNEWDRVPRLGYFVSVAHKGAS